MPALNAKNFEYRLIQSNNIQRQELLQQKCDKYYLDNNEVDRNKSIYTLSEVEMEHLLIDRNHKFLYCYVPKVRSDAKNSFFNGYSDDSNYKNISKIRILGVVTVPYMIIQLHCS